MNFYGHAVVATRYRQDPAFVLGAMLPDFAGMARVRVTSVPEAVRAGVACHHEVDGAFHGADAFFASCARDVDAMTRDGVPRGAARAVAHVGLELVLDAHLVRTLGPSDLYVEALREGTRLVRDGSLVLRDGMERDALSDLLHRLVAYGGPAGDAPPSYFTTRLARMLQHRPRLAIPPEAEPAVTRAVADMIVRIPGLGPELLRAASAHAEEPFT